MSDVKELMDLGIEMDRLRRENANYEKLWDEFVVAEVKKSMGGIKTELISNWVTDHNTVNIKAEFSLEAPSVLNKDNPEVLREFADQLREQITNKILIQLMTTLRRL